MQKEKLYDRVYEMIISSTKKPKYTGLSTVKIASLLGTTPGEVENGLSELLKEGRLQKATLEEPPHYDIYLLP